MSVFQAPSLTADNFKQWLEYLVAPSKQDGAAAVGFHTTLWEAVVEANATDKPVLLWAMNGHPMACT